MLSACCSNSDEALRLLKPFLQGRVPLVGIGTPHSHRQRFCGSHQDDKLLASRNRCVEQVPLEHEVVLGVDGNDDAGKL